jgi:hypothetical protein
MKVIRNIGRRNAVANGVDPVVTAIAAEHHSLRKKGKKEKKKKNPKEKKNAFLRTWLSSWLPHRQRIESSGSMWKTGAGAATCKKEKKRSLVTVHLPCSECVYGGRESQRINEKVKTRKIGFFFSSDSFSRLTTLLQLHLLAAPSRRLKVPKCRNVSPRGDQTGANTKTKRKQKEKKEKIKK